MGKAKPVKAAAQAVAAAPSKVLNGVKSGKVTKPGKGKKDISKSSVAKKEIEKKITKAPTPSDSEDSASSDSESESDSDESSASESEAEVKPKAAAQKPKVNGVNGVKKQAKDDSSSEEDSDSDSDDSDDSAPAVKANGVKSTAATAGAADDDSDSDSDSSNDSEDGVADQAARFQPDSDASDDSDDSDSASDSDEEAPVAKTNGAAKAAAADSDDDDSEDGSEDDSEDASSSEDEEEKPKADAKKRKAEEPAEPAFKKTKVAEEQVDESGASKTLFVGHLSWGVDEDGLYKEFEEFGEIASCKIMYHQDSGKSKGFGYVEFSTIAEAIAAKNALHEKMIDGREVNIDFATPRVERPRPSFDDRAKKYGDVESAPSDTIFVGNISFDATYDHIKEAFEQYGTITRISLPTDRETGTPKGFGYVGFSSVEEATEALNALKGAEIGGRPVRLDFAQARQDDGGAPRGGRGGGGRGGGRGFGGDRGGRGRGRGGFDRGGRGGGRGFGGDRGGRGRGGGSFNRGGFGDFQGKKTSF